MAPSASPKQKRESRISAFRKQLQKYNEVELTLGIVGVLALVTMIGALFLPFDSKQEMGPLTEPLTVASPEFLDALSRLVHTPVERGETVRILNNGDEFLPVLLSAISEAQHTVNFTTYVWQKGEYNDRVSQAFLEAARRGVEVRILLDSHASRMPRETTQALEGAGVKIENYNSPSLGKFTRYHKRTHRRAIIIDGRIGFLGGAAVEDKWLGGGREKKEWRDLMFEVKGEMAESLQSAFVSTWNALSGEVFVGDAFYPHETPDTAPSQSSDISQFVHVVSSPAPDNQPIQKIFWLTVAGSKEKLYIANPYLLPDRPLIDALKERAQDGVDVRILVPGKHIDAKQVRLAGMANYTELLESGVKIYEYEPTMLHTKIITADGKWSVIGSANIDSRSRILNTENVMGIADPRLATDLEKVFLGDLEYAHEITLEEWKRKQWFIYPLSILSQILGKQY